ncbi:MAG: hypothetical protein KKE05_00900, partial [Nanoarchaeota archaeon]|nr:hypothetical protein [Nanoarchaeota archaeon]
DTYDYVSSCGAGSGSGKRWIAYAPCGSSLQGYGYETGGAISGGTCDTRGWSYKFNVPYNPVGSCELQGSGDLVARLYDCSSEFGEGRLCICENDDDGVGFDYKRFILGFGEAGVADTSPTSTSPSMEVEVSC